MANPMLKLRQLWGLVPKQKCGLSVEDSHLSSWNYDMYRKCWSMLASKLEWKSKTAGEYTWLEDCRLQRESPWCFFITQYVYAYVHLLVGVFHSMLEQICMQWHFLKVHPSLKFGGNSLMMTLDFRTLEL